MKQPLISIVSLTWNGGDHIKQTVPKLLELNYENLEIIFVDNGSTDGTKEYLKEFKDIQLIENSDNKGISVAKNQGVKKAKGDYVLMMDDDMLIRNEDFLINILDFYSRLEEPAFLMPLMIESTDQDSLVTRAYGSYYDLFGVDVRYPQVPVSVVQAVNEPIEIVISQGGMMFFERKVWNRLGGFDESQLFNLDDDDISTRAYVMGYKNYLYNKEYVVHLGMNRRLDAKSYAWKARTYYSGKAKAIVKNFSFPLMPLLWFMATGRMTAEAIYHSFTYMHIGILFSHIYSMFVFVRDIGDTLKKRKKIQKKRKVADKDFFWMRAPDYMNMVDGDVGEA